MELNMGEAHMLPIMPNRAFLSQLASVAPGVLSLVNDMKGQIEPQGVNSPYSYMIAPVFLTFTHRPS